MNGQLNLVSLVLKNEIKKLNFLNKLPFLFYKDVWVWFNHGLNRLWLRNFSRRLLLTLSLSPEFIHSIKLSLLYKFTYLEYCNDVCDPICRPALYICNKYLSLWSVQGCSAGSVLCGWQRSFFSQRISESPYNTHRWGVGGPEATEASLPTEARNKTQNATSTLNATCVGGGAPATAPSLLTPPHSPSSDATDVVQTGLVPSLPAPLPSKHKRRRFRTRLIKENRRGIQNRSYSYFLF